jgi:hypothetical protein
MIIDNQAQYFIREADVRTREKIKEIERDFDRGKYSYLCGEFEKGNLILQKAYYDYKQLINQLIYNEIDYELNYKIQEIINKLNRTIAPVEYHISYFDKKKQYISIKINYLQEPSKKELFDFINKVDDPNNGDKVILSSPGNLNFSTLVYQFDGLDWIYENI